MDVDLISLGKEKREKERSIFFFVDLTFLENGALLKVLVLMI